MLNITGHKLTKYGLTTIIELRLTGHASQCCITFLITISLVQGTQCFEVGHSVRKYVDLPIMLYDITLTVYMHDF